MHAVSSIAKKEFMNSFRNYEVPVLAIIFTVLPVFISYAASGGHGFQDPKAMITIMNAFAAFLIPLIGLMLGYAAIIGEIEKGSMGSLLAHPVTRKEVVVGKFLGLGSVICSTILIGLSIAGAIIAANVPNADYGVYLVFIAGSILLGLAFLSLALSFSSFVKSNSAAVGMVIALWFFFAICWPILTMAITTAVEGTITSDYWSNSIHLLNPIWAYTSIGSGNPNAPSIYWILLSLIAWIIIPLIIAFWRFKRRDI